MGRKLVGEGSWVPMRSATKSYITSWCIQNLSKRALNRHSININNRIRQQGGNMSVLPEVRKKRERKGMVGGTWGMWVLAPKVPDQTLPMSGLLCELTHRLPGVPSLPEFPGVSQKVNLPAPKAWTRSPRSFEATIISCRSNKSTQKYAPNSTFCACNLHFPGRGIAPSLDPQGVGGSSDCPTPSPLPLTTISRMYFCTTWDPWIKIVQCQTVSVIVQLEWRFWITIGNSGAMHFNANP